MRVLTPQDIFEQADSPKFTPGQLSMDEFGRVWIYLQASEALSFGNVLMPNMAVADATVDLAAAVDTRRVRDVGAFTTTVLADIGGPDQVHGHIYRLWINAGAAQNQGGVISRRVDDDYVDVYWETSDDGKIGTALTVASEYMVYCLSRVAKTTAATSLAIGVAQMAITDEYWFWGLHKGHGWVLLDGDGNAPTATMDLIPTTTAGACAGMTASPTVAELACAFAKAIIDTDQTTDCLIPALINCEKTCPVGQSGVPSNLDYDYPKR